LSVNKPFAGTINNFVFSDIAQIVCSGGLGDVPTIFWGVPPYFGPTMMCEIKLNRIPPTWSISEIGEVSGGDYSSADNVVSPMCVLQIPIWYVAISSSCDLIWFKDVASKDV